MKPWIYTEDIRRMFAGGTPVKDIASIFGCDPSNVVYHLNKDKMKDENGNELDLKEWINNNCFSRSGSLNNRISLDSWWINRKFDNRKKEIEDITSWLEASNITHRIWHILNEMNCRPICKTCGGMVEFRQYKSGYREYCSLYCVTQGAERNRKIGEHPARIIAAQKMHKVMKEKYGLDWLSSNSIHQLNIQKNKHEKYGCQFVNKEKSHQTCLEKYGTAYYYQSDDFKRKSRSTKIERDSLYQSGNFGNISSAEKEITKFLLELGFDFRKTRALLDDGREVDGYCEEKKFAFEYCGLYWHCELVQKDKHYHSTKMRTCREKGINLFTIFEDEWIYKRELVEQFLKAKLGVFKERIPARKCKIVIDRDVRDFFRNNHIQGVPNRINSSVSLEYDGKIVSSMSFGLHHRNNEEMTLNRYATLDGVQVIGGASKIFSTAKNHLDCDIVTWSDNRWTDGLLYQKLGFKLDREYGPDYSYMNGRNRFSKQSMMKSLTGCPKEKTEHQWALENKFYRIYDCGKKRWVFSKGN